MAMFVEGQDPLVQADGPGPFNAPVLAPDLVLEEDGPGRGNSRSKPAPVARSS